MIPARIVGCTRVLGAPPGWTPETGYSDLSVENAKPYATLISDYRVG